MEKLEIISKLSLFEWPTKKWVERVRNLSLLSQDYQQFF